MEKMQTERTVYLKDLVFSALYCWKWILVAMLVFGLLLGGMELQRKQDTVELNAISVTPEKQLKIDQLNSTITETQSMIEQRTQYLEESVLMKVDPYNVYTAGKVYFVVQQPEVSEQLEFGSVILQNYINAFNESSAIETAAKTLDIPQWAISELITLSVNSNGGLSVTVLGRTAEEAKAVAEAVCQIVEKQQEEVISRTVQHTLTSLPFSTGPRVNTGLYNQQTSAKQVLTTLTNSLTAAKTELAKLTPTELVQREPKVLLFAVAGAAIGAFLVCALAWIGHISVNKIYSGRTLKNSTGVRLLGCVAEGRKYDPVTRWLRKLEGRSQYGQTDVVAANIRNRCESGTNLLFLGNYDAQWIQPMVKKLEENGIRCVLCADPAVTVQVYEALPNCDAVVLVETCGVSRYDSVLWEMETVTDHKKELLGCVLIGG